MLHDKTQSSPGQAHATAQVNLRNSASSYAFSQHLQTGKAALHETSLVEHGAALESSHQF